MTPLPLSEAKNGKDTVSPFVLRNSEKCLFINYDSYRESLYNILMPYS